MGASITSSKTKIRCSEHRERAAPPLGDAASPENLSVSLVVNASVHIANAGGVLVFLDLAADRYCAFDRSWSERALSPDGDTVSVQERLNKAGLGGGPHQKTLAITLHPRATRDASIHDRLASPASAPAVFLGRARAAAAFRRHSIESIVARRALMRAHGKDRIPPREEILRYCATEVLARREGDCLTRALGLLLHLGRRGSGLDWVFGVTGAPFSAHCWIQAGDEVLNDSIEVTRAYTPILIA